MFVATSESADEPTRADLLLRTVDEPNGALDPSWFQAGEHGPLLDFPHRRDVLADADLAGLRLREWADAARRG